MAKIHIVTDSTAYLPPEEIKRFGITVLPLKVIFSNNEYNETDINDNDQFIDMIKKEYPSTSPPSLDEFWDAFSEKTADGGEVISIHLSSGLSETVQTALGVTKMMQNGDRVSVVDSGTMGIGMRLLVLTASLMAERGRSREEIVNILNRKIATMRTIFMPSTLEYLKKGGRIGGAQALLGKILQIKPVLNIVDGKVDVLDKIRTADRAIQRMIQELPKDLSRHEVFTVHWHDKPGAEELKKMIKDNFDNANIHVAELGPVIGIHVGPGLLGILYAEKI
jgi:DegV family protein with EDD domain